MVKFNSPHLEINVSEIDLGKIKNNLDSMESSRLSPFAAQSRNGVRRRQDPQTETGYRQCFSLDVDRILHSLAYTRYIDKTQVFSLIANDHITHRVLHVQLLSKIARTIGRFLSLNEDLIEAIALGHDIGHPPFGHEGERILSSLCRIQGIGSFVHSVQSIQFLDQVERDGQGWNLCLQTLDGILCHDGEIHDPVLEPDPDKSFHDLEAEVRKKIETPECRLRPMTLEGCVVRMADTISYIGRDLEDAIRLGLIKRTDIPANIVNILGNTNGTIVYTLVTDVIKSSLHQGYTAFSSPVSEALENLKRFNLERIYNNPRTRRHLGNIESLYGMLFEKFISDLKDHNVASVIFAGFLKNKSKNYIERNRDPEIVRDFVSGMTDSYFLSQCPADVRPVPIFL
jgi:dGTPase